MIYGDCSRIWLYMAPPLWLMSRLLRCKGVLGSWTLDIACMNCLEVSDPEFGVSDLLMPCISDSPAKPSFRPTAPTAHRLTETFGTYLESVLYR